MTIEEKEKNFDSLKRLLSKLFDSNEEAIQKFIDSLSGEWAIKNASFGMSADSGSAYEGALLENALKISIIARGINKLLPSELQRDDVSICKVAFLSHLSKVVMYEKNTNDWEIKNRGMIYKFSTSDIYLKSGERSLLICMNAGIKFTDEEFEAMRVMDRLKENDTATSWQGVGILATIIRQANELVALENKNNVKK